MNRRTQTVILLAIQISLVLAIAGKAYVDRGRLPRVWVKTAAADPDLPFRGRYVSLRLLIDCDCPANSQNDSALVRINNGQLRARVAPRSRFSQNVSRGPSGWVLDRSVAFFVPEHIPDPSRRGPGEELWVEVSVPDEGPPRPIRLGVRRSGSDIEPIVVR